MSLDLLTGVSKGTIYHQHAGGGGGYGDPKKRAKELVALDVKNEVVSQEAARTLYGFTSPEKTHDVILNPSKADEESPTTTPDRPTKKSRRKNNG